MVSSLSDEEQKRCGITRNFFANLIKSEIGGIYKELDESGCDSEDERQRVRDLMLIHMRKNHRLATKMSSANNIEDKIKESDREKTSK